MAFLHRDGYWVLDFTINGRRFTEATAVRGSSQRVRDEVKRLQKERRSLKKTELEVEERKSVRNKRGKVIDLPINSAFDEYYDAQGRHAKRNGATDILRELQWVVRRLGEDFMLGDLDTETLIRLREIRRQEFVVCRTKDGLPKVINKETGERKPQKVISARSCNITFEKLKFCLNWLKGVGREVQEIAWAQVWIEETPRETEYTEGHRAKIRETFRADYLPILEFALLAGARKRQFVELRWDNIDFERHTITFMRQKKRGAKRAPKPHPIPITPRMLMLILEQIDPETRLPYHAERVWTYIADRTCFNPRTRTSFEKGKRYPITYEGFSTMWARWKKRESVTNLRIHDIRHAAGNLLHEATDDLTIVRDGLGHSNLATSERYVRRKITKLRAAMEARDALIREHHLNGTYNQSHNQED
jgi:integrase